MQTLADFPAPSPEDLHILQAFGQLYSDLQTDNTFPNRRPLLAHYTSIPVLESIFRTNQIWFSNPLFMNDSEEVSFGVNVGRDMFAESKELADACGSEERFELLKSSFLGFYNLFANEHVLDTFVFCLSEHHPENTDGSLSMWRGYGSNGNGAAIVFDTAKLNFHETSPLVISNVRYGSQEQRRTELKELVGKFATIIRGNNITNDKLGIAAFAFFQRLKLFALFSKHHGFIEENEWRAVYLPDRDITKKFSDMLGYSLGTRGVEPKLKFTVEPIEGLSDPDLSLEKIVSKIILGPSLSSPLAFGTLKKMFQTLKRPAMVERLVSSSIPFRAVERP